MLNKLIFKYSTDFISFDLQICLLKRFYILVINKQIQIFRREIKYGTVMSIKAKGYNKVNIYQ